MCEGACGGGVIVEGVGRVGQGIEGVWVVEVGRVVTVAFLHKAQLTVLRTLHMSMQCVYLCYLHVHR